MNNLMKRMPLLAFVVAAVFAFAFTEPNENQDLYGSPDRGETWQNATNMILGTDYNCNLGIVDEHCLYSQPIYDQVFGQGNNEERFVLIP